MKVSIEILFDLDIDPIHKDVIGDALFENVAETMPGVIFGKTFDAIIENFELVKTTIKEG